MIGLYNLGATCFLNVCIQLLLHTPEIIKVLLLDSSNFAPQLKDSTKKILEKKLVLSFLKLYQFQQQQSNTPNTYGTVQPIEFYKDFQALAKEVGHPLQYHEQHDVAECMEFLLDHFHQSLAHPVNIHVTGTPNTEQDELAVLCYEYLQKQLSKEFSHFSTLLYGIQVSTLLGKQSAIPRRRAELFSVLCLNLPPNINQPTLDDCLRYYLSPETLEDVHYEDNEKGWDIRETTEKKLQIWSFPPILMLEIRRRDQLGDKNNTLVSYPEELDLSHFALDYNSSNYHYSLCAVVNHFGNYHGGHYSLFLRDTHNNDNWFHINDEQIQSIDKNIVMNNCHASCLLYLKS